MFQNPMLRMNTGFPSAVWQNGGGKVSLPSVPVPDYPHQNVERLDGEARGGTTERHALGRAASRTLQRTLAADGNPLGSGGGLNPPKGRGKSKPLWACLGSVTTSTLREDSPVRAPLNVSAGRTVRRCAGRWSSNCCTIHESPAEIL